MTRLSGEDRTGVGLRRWVRQDTPALSPQTEQRLTNTPASAVPAFPNFRHLRQRALPSHQRPPRAQPSAETWGPGGDYLPRRGSGQRPEGSGLSLFLSILPFLVRCRPAGQGGGRVAISASFLYTSLFQRVHHPSGAASRRERLRAGFPPPPGRVSASGCACARVGVRRSRRSPREGNFSNQVKEGMRT